MSSVLSMSLRGRTQQFHANIALNALRHNYSQTVARAANTKSGLSLFREKTTQPPQKTPRPVVPKLTGVAINKDPRKIVFRPNNAKYRSSKDSLPSQTSTSNTLGHKTVVKQSYCNGVVNESLHWGNYSDQGQIFRSTKCYLMCSGQATHRCYNCPGEAKSVMLGVGAGRSKVQ
jgi:hypothetical protein